MWETQRKGGRVRFDWLSFGILRGFCECFLGQTHNAVRHCVFYVSNDCLNQYSAPQKLFLITNHTVLRIVSRIMMDAYQSNQRRWCVYAPTQTCINGFFFFFPPPSLYFSCQSNKVPVVQHPHHVHPLTPLITYSNEHFTPGNPPPHLQADVDPKTGTYACTSSFTFMNIRTGRTKPKAILQAWLTNSVVPVALCDLADCSVCTAAFTATW